MSNVAVHAGRAGVAGALIAAGIGLGAYNAWWVALCIAVPLVIAGLLVAPRPSRLSELPVFRPATGAPSAPIRVDALTRSSLATADLQPTLVTATISPPNDTAYQARWIASMSRGDFRSLTDSPLTALPPDRLPPRAPNRTPDFADQPGKWAVIYPGITVVATLAVLFGVGDAWHVSISLPSAPAVHRPAETDKKATDLDARRDAMVRAVTAKLGPTAPENLLDLRFTDSGSDYGTVFNPANGDATTVYISSSGDVYTTAVPNTLRKTSTFAADDLASTSLTAVADKMAQQFRSAGKENRLETLEIKRSGPEQPIMLTGTFSGPNTFPFSRTIDARPDGTIAELFDPSDFAVSFRRAREALQSAGIAPSDRVVTTLQIRGITENTPNLHASEIQNSGGVLVEFESDDRSGSIVIVPGHFPEITDRSGSASDGFAFDDVSPATFDSVRAQAMQRGSLEPYESRAVDIEMSDPRTDRFGLAIRIELAGVDAAAGTYSPTGEFLAQGT
ncbi:hypothetical protein [Mycobacterium talmoniae]|uniref:Uncharacterized protein n=1 Tax=Mycobacterium talmoniae TaxID=1858794 RepID=A0A1S1NMP1_9MYCO|nr:MULTISPECIES: hypothetical protein [Mycobacterium]OHV05278.1 hypothetical protein BKN37_06360 [Mycobacterium talmoniae]PQM46832.1 hypothetical protein C1Y40_03002 [Mycobacterium talmoniae]TDH52283.1 hypothetical protein E2F47_14605 [Mycobacterium eburneum]